MKFPSVTIQVIANEQYFRYCLLSGSLLSVVGALTASVIFSEL